MGIKLNTAKQAFPMIYAYSTPQIADHNGWTKSDTPRSRM